MSGLATRSCVFTNCNFTFAELYDSVHTYSAFVNCEFGGANLFSSSWIQCKCTGSSFYTAKLTGILLEKGNYSYTIFTCCDLHKMDLSGVDFSHANLQECNLEKSVLRGANLSHTVFKEANLTGADLREAETEGTDLKSGKLHNTKIDLRQAVWLAESMGCLVV